MKLRSVGGDNRVDCPIADEWRSHQETVKKPISQIDEMHNSITQILKHTQHLTKLDALEDIRDSLLDSATGRNHLDLKTATTLFRLLGWVIGALLLTILFLLTGQHFNILTLFKPG
jgi:hypothetical protein